MLLTLAFRHLVRRKRRSAVLLLGFALGVAVMIVLLSIGEAMLEQARDEALVGGGEVTVLPQGVDLEALRTGALGGMFVGIDRARFVGRQGLAGPRHARAVSAVSPVIENKLLYLAIGDSLVAVRAGAEVPSRARAAGAGQTVLQGAWEDTRTDSAWVHPSRQQLYDELDRFHLPAVADSTWGEWHYFNVDHGDEWWYVTYLVGGLVGEAGRWGGQLLITHRQKDGRHVRYEAAVPDGQVSFDTTRADLILGVHAVHQRGGQYVLSGRARGPGGELLLDLTVRPAPHRYFPPLELRSDSIVSGYVVPGLRAEATGRICVGRECTWLSGAPAYHDHNWGVWRDVTWEWGMGRGAGVDLLYGGVRGAGGRFGATAAPFFLALADADGLRQVFRFREIAWEGSRPVFGVSGIRAPERFTLQAARERDTLHLRVEVVDAHASRSGTGTLVRTFLQLRGRFRLEGRIAGRAVADSGLGFFETFVR